MNKYTEIPFVYRSYDELRKMMEYMYSEIKYNSKYWCNNKRRAKGLPYLRKPVNVRHRVFLSTNTLVYDALVKLNNFEFGNVTDVVANKDIVVYDKRFDDFVEYERLNKL